MNCSKCGYAFEEDDHAIEIITGTITNGWVHPDRSDAVLCVKCEEQVMPAFWADVNED